MTVPVSSSLPQEVVLFPEPFTVDSSSFQAVCLKLPFPNLSESSLELCLLSGQQSETRLQ